ncbi:MAG: type IA DNA topoisomerase [Janthinobacterium lividum]
MTEQLVIAEKSSQARDIRAAVGGRYGLVLPAEGHLIDLQEPEQARPEWKRWSTALLRPEGLYGTRAAEGGGKAAKLGAIRDALRTARRVWLATDCDREGQLIGQEILEHLGFRGEVMRVMFTAQDPQTIRDAFAGAKPNGEYARLYAAAVARRQADQIYNLSLTRTATVTLARGTRSVIGVGRVKTPTLAIVCRRENEIRAFRPEAYFEVVATAQAALPGDDAGAGAPGVPALADAPADGAAPRDLAPGQFRMRHAPKQRLLKREDAEAVAALAEGFRGPLAVSVEDRRQAPPRLHDLPSLQKLCATRFGWTAARTLDVAQALYDGSGKKIITYPRAEVRCLPESLIPDAPRLVAALRRGRSFAAIPVPDPPVIRRGAGGAFSDRGLAGASHHAVIPNANTADKLGEVWPRLDADERRLFDVIARSYLAALMPDFRFRQTVAELDVAGHLFRASGRQPIEAGWRAAFPDWLPAEERGEDAQALPALRDGEPVRLQDAAVEDKETRPPPRYNEGTLIDAMQNAWRFVPDPALRERLREAKGIGTPATRAEVIRGLKAQELLAADGKNVVPTERGLALHGVLERADPALVDPGVTAQMERLLDDVLLGRQEMAGAVDAVCDQATRIIARLVQNAADGTAPALPPAAAAAKAAPGRRFPAKAGRAKAALPRGARRGAPRGKPRPAPDDAAPDAAPDAAARPARAKRAVPRRTAARPASGADAGAGGAAPGTTLRIPFGNKEAAMSLGARYGAAGWYAPPGVDLDAFRARGWV